MRTGLPPDKGEDKDKKTSSAATVKGRAGKDQVSELDLYEEDEEKMFTPKRNGEYRPIGILESIWKMVVEIAQRRTNN